MRMALGAGASREYNRSMDDMDPLPASERLRLAFDLYDVGEGLLRQRFRREHPEMSAGDIEARVDEWRLRRPGGRAGRRGRGAGPLAPKTVNPVSAALRRAAEDLNQLGHPWALVGGLAVSARARLATARLHAPVASPVVVDLLFASSGIEREVTQHAELMEVLPGIVTPVAAVGAPDFSCASGKSPASRASWAAMNVAERSPT